MDPLTLMAIMAAANLAKSQFVDKPAADRQRTLKAETQRYAPFSGLSDNSALKEADPLGSTLGGAGQGLMLGQALQDSADKNAFNDRYLKILEKNGAPGGLKNQWMYPQNPAGDYTGSVGYSG